MNGDIKRREFLKVGAGAGAMFGATRLFGASAPSNRVRLALVGCHAKGRGIEVLNASLGVPGIEFACVCDVDSRAMDFAANLIARKTGVKPRKEKDFRKVLEMKDVDGVVSETPDHFHAYSAIMAMRAGKHVYVEKPCAYCPREAELILDAWKKTGRVFQMGNQRRALKSNRDAVEALRTGKLIGAVKSARCWYTSRRKPIGNGQKIQPPSWLDWNLWQGPAPRTGYQDNVVHYNWHWFYRWGTGECGNNSIHFADVCRWCLGEAYPVRVTSAGGKFYVPESDDWKFPDVQTAFYEFPNGKFMTWEGNSCENQWGRRGFGSAAEVMGSDGSLLFKPNGEVEVYDMKKALVRKWKVDGAPADLADTSNRQGGGWKDSTGDHMANFLDCIRENAPEKAYSNAREATTSTLCALAANVSLRLGAPVHLDPATGALVKGSAGAELWAREYEKGWELA